MRKSQKLMNVKDHWEILGDLFRQLKKHILSRMFLTHFVPLLVIGAVVIAGTWRSSVRSIQADARRLAEMAAAGIQQTQIDDLGGNFSDLSCESYLEIKNSLISLNRLDNEIQFIYLYTQKDGKIYFLADSETVDSLDYCPPGQEYTDADAELYVPFSTGSTYTTGKYTDKWGTWVSVLVPITDSGTGKPIAVLGIDYPAGSWYDHAVIRTIQAGAIVLCVLLIFLIFYLAYIQNYELLQEKKKLMAVSARFKENQVLFKTIYEQAPIGIAIGSSQDDRISNNENQPSYNPMFAKIVGRTPEQMQGITWMEITHPDDLLLDIEKFNQFKSGEIDGYEMEKRYLKPDGSVVWIRMMIAALKLEDSEQFNHLCIIEDISNRKTMERALHDSERSKAVLLSNLLGMAYRCQNDEQWTMQFVSEGCFSLTGYRAESLLCNRDISYNEIIAPEHRQRIWRESERRIASNQPFRYEYEIISASGERKWVMETGQGIYDESGAVTALEGIIIDITEQKKREEQIKYMNDHDYVTGLYNRRYYEEMISKMDTDAYLPLSVISVDINGVRLINDAFGYAEGDKLIRQTSLIISDCCRPRDICARVGGDEFGMILPNTGADDAYERLKQIMEACTAYNKNNNNRRFEVNLSIGYATKKTANQNISDVLKSADEFLRNRKLLNSKSFHSELMSSIQATVYEKSHETEEHAKRIASMSKAMGEKLNLTQKTLGQLELFSMLHDIGKVGIDDRILKKPGELTEDEWTVMRTHTQIGYRIAQSASELEPIAGFILTHHERWDGTGYPQGLKGEEIPLLSRIVAISDSYDAMTNDRVYRKAMTREAAIAEIREHSGTQFDPRIVAVFLEIMHEQAGQSEK